MPCTIVRPEAVGGNCRCGKPLDPPHVTDSPTGIHCAACCPVHSVQASIEWGQKQPETIAGEQGALFPTQKRIPYAD